MESQTQAFLLTKAVSSTFFFRKRYSFCKSLFKSTIISNFLSKIFIQNEISKAAAEKVLMQYLVWGLMEPTLADSETY